MRAKTGGKRRKPKADEVIFVSALLFVVGGLGLLLKTTGFVEKYSLLWPLILVAGGGVLFFLSVTRAWRAESSFIGAFLASCGLALFLAAVFGWTLEQFWPLFAIALGLSLLPPGYIKFHAPRGGYILSAIGLCALGGFFSLLSFKVIVMPLKEIVASFWPILIVLAGILLFVMYGYNRRRFGPRGRPPKGEA